MNVTQRVELSRASFYMNTFPSALIVLIVGAGSCIERWGVEGNSDHRQRGK